MKHFILSLLLNVPTSSTSFSHKKLSSAVFVHYHKKAYIDRINNNNVVFMLHSALYHTAAYSDQ